MTDRLYTATEVADQLGISVAWVKRLAQRGIGRQVGKVWIFTAADIERLRERRTARGRPPGKEKRDE
jgi:hypothetical protein